MTCITINGSTYVVGTTQYYGYRSSSIDNRYAEGSWVNMTPEENLTRAIAGTIKYLGGRFLTTYGHTMTRLDICGQNTITPEEPPTPPGDDMTKDIIDTLNEPIFKIGDTEIKKSYLLTAGIIILAAYFLLRK